MRANCWGLSRKSNSMPILLAPATMQNDAAYMMDKCYAKPADESHLHTIPQIPTRTHNLPSACKHAIHELDVEVTPFLLFFRSFK